MNNLLEKSEAAVMRTQSAVVRYLYPQIRWQNRLDGIKGPRGTGKTTLLLQRLR